MQMMRQCFIPDRTRKIRSKAPLNVHLWLGDLAAFATRAMLQARGARSSPTVAARPSTPVAMADRRDAAFVGQSCVEITA
jgi:hypothetical protein